MILTYFVRKYTLQNYNGKTKPQHVPSAGSTETKSRPPQKYTQSCCNTNTSLSRDRLKQYFKFLLSSGGQIDVTPGNQTKLTYPPSLQEKYTHIRAESIKSNLPGQMTSQQYPPLMPRQQSPPGMTTMP